MYCSLNLRKTHLINSDKFSTECGQLMGMFWQQTFGDESEAIKFCHPRWQISAEPRVYLGIPFTRVTVNLDLRLVTCEAPLSPQWWGLRGWKFLILTTLDCWKKHFGEKNYIELQFTSIYLLKLYLKNVEKILFGWIFLWHPYRTNSIKNMSGFITANVIAAVGTKLNLLGMIFLHSYHSK